MERETLIVAYKLIITSLSLWMNNCPERGMVTSSDFKFWSHPHEVSEISKATVFKLNN